MTFIKMLTQINRLSHNKGSLKKAAFLYLYGNQTHKDMNKIRKFPERHGMYKHRLYRIYQKMIIRCYNPNYKDFKYYGGKGVEVCEEWKNDRCLFFKWALENGYEDNLQLDKDIRGNGMLYSPNTCLWVTCGDNIRGRSNSVYLEFDGKKLNISEWSRISGISHMTIQRRIDSGWEPHDILTVKPLLGNKKLRKGANNKQINTQKFTN